MRWERISHNDWLLYAGLFTVACVGIPLLQDTVHVLRAWFEFGAYSAESIDGVSREEALGLVGWWIAYLVFPVAYWFCIRLIGVQRARIVRFPLLISMNAAAVAISWFSQSGLSGILLLVIAGVLPWLLSTRPAVFWMMAQNLTLLPVFFGFTDELGEPKYSGFEALLQSFLYLGFSSFTFVTSYIGKQQADARENLRALNAELRATRTLLAESTRVAERVRIARELHDLVGHHLTALTLNLEFASHLVQGPARDKVQQAQSVAKLLLGDVREVVSQMRDEAEIDLRSAINTLVEGVPQPKVHVDFPADFAMDDPHRAQIFLRIAQEILTNTIRHARAENLWWRFHRDNQQNLLCLDSRDDGVGSKDVRAGNGLAGMEERVLETGGQLRIDTAPGQGFALHIEIPAENKHDFSRSG
jgi:signal transduction histidine kinase